MKTIVFLAGVLCAAMLFGGCTSNPSGDLSENTQSGDPQSEDIIKNKEILPVSDGDDITAALQNAIDIAGHNSVIVIPAGNYTISMPVKIEKDNITVCGIDKNATIIKYGGGEAPNAVEVRASSGVTLGEFSLDMNGVEINAGISLLSSENITISNVDISNMRAADWPAAALYFHETHSSYVTECSFSNLSIDFEWGCAMRISNNSHDLTIESNVIRDTGRGGILANTGSAGLIIRNNTVERVGLAPNGQGLSIELWEDCGNSLIEDNKVSSWISVDRSPNTAVRRNIVDNPGERISPYGLEAVGSQDCVFTGNIIRAGIQIGLSSSNVLPKEYFYWGNNEIYNCHQWGAQFQGEDGFCRYQYFYNCTIKDTYKNNQPIYPGAEGHAFRLNGNCEYFIFDGCDFSENEGDGFQNSGVGISDIYYIDTIFENNGGNAAAKDKERFISRDILPVAGFTAPSSAKVGELVTFTGTPDGNGCPIVRLLWDFDDGIPENGGTVTHAYEKPGAYTVTLIVWNESGYGGRYAADIIIS